MLGDVDGGLDTSTWSLLDQREPDLGLGNALQRPTMSIQLVPDHHPRLVPPLELPLRCRFPRGLFSVDRMRAQKSVSGPTGTFSHTPLQHHVGLDLLADSGSPVFAARRGDVVQISGDTDDRWVAVRHVQPGGQHYLDPGDRHLVALLQDAYMFQKPLRLASWESHFFAGFRVIRAARVVG